MREEIEQFLNTETEIRGKIIEQMKNRFSLKDFLLAGLDKSYVHRILSGKTPCSTRRLIEIFNSMEQYDAGKSVKEQGTIITRFDDEVVSQ